MFTPFSEESVRPSAGETTASIESLGDQCRLLLRLVQVILVSLLVLSSALSVFFLREVSGARKQARELSRYVSDYQKNSEPLIADLRARLHEFADQHPDFRPIYLKYFGPGASPGASPSSILSLPGTGEP